MKEISIVNSNKPPTVIIVEDEALIAESLRMMLAKQGFDVVAACFSGEEAIAAIDKLSAAGSAPDVALMDITLPGKVNGVEAAIEINSRHDTAIVFLTGYNQSGLYEKLSDARYYGYLLKPVSPEQLRSTIEYAFHQKRLERKPRNIPRDKPAGTSDSHTRENILANMEKRLVGVSETVHHIREEILVLAPSTIPMLLIGETGTGKEIITRELYMASKRSAMPFLPVNCATLGTLADSELFGHMKGAFTGAVRSTTGYLGAANGGTLFLDEVEALSLEIQAKLLRFLDTGEYSKVGDTKTLHTDVRIISASNKDIETLCSQGRFRQDLFYRLSGAVIRTTPLRSRREDIPILASHFLRLFAAEAGRKPPTMLPDAMKTISAHEWPGNARQLKQVIHNLFERHRHRKTIDAAETAKLLGVPSQKVEFPSYQDAKQSSLDQFHRKYFADLLGMTRGKVKTALALSQMHRKNFYDLLKKLGVSPKDFR